MSEPTDALVEPRHALSTTLLLSAASVATAFVAMLGEKGSFSALTVAGALAGLVPWALVAGGVRVPPPLFALLGLVPGIVIVVAAGNPGGMFPIMLVVVWITRTSQSRWLIAATIAAGAGAIVALTIIDGSAHESGLIYFTGGLGISWLAGLMLRRQEALTLELQAMHDLQVEQLALSERTRIAREVHDVVAHSLTIVMLNLTGARRALATQPERADEALARAEAVGRESLDSIRQMMGLLREPGSGLDLPQPGLGDVVRLIESYRSAGLTVTSAALDPVLATANIDPTVQLVVYRVVQESLANVLQHAPGASAAVTVSFEPSAGHLRVSVANGSRSTHAVAGRDRAGLGIRGMTERVRAVGGQLHAGPTDASGWQVVVVVPTRATAIYRDEAEMAWVTRSSVG